MHKTQIAALLTSVLDAPLSRPRVQQIPRELLDRTYKANRPKTPEDLRRIEAAQAKRSRRAEKRQKIQERQALKALAPDTLTVDEVDWASGPDRAVGTGMYYCWPEAGEVHIHPTPEDAQACIDARNP